LYRVERLVIALFARLLLALADAHSARTLSLGSPLHPCGCHRGIQRGRPAHHFDRRSYDACGLRNRLDYILISESPVSSFRGGGVFRKGLWGKRKTRPDDWETYPEMANGNQQASDHAAIYIDLAL
jgi:hypothetical protein